MAATGRRDPRRIGEDEGRGGEPVRFSDRRDAGRRLADRLAVLGLTRPVVLGLPRGGVPVAAEVAQRLAAPLEAFIARKVGAPGQPELGIGAIAEGLEEPVVAATAARVGVDAALMRSLAARERQEVEQRVATYRRGRALPDLTGCEAILVDDGLATGVTAEAALRSLRRHDPCRLILAAPVCARETAQRLAALADDVVCLESPANFFAVGEWYADFRQTTDDEVLELLSGRREPLD
jgi:putative phosphoribosyl transferase